MGFWSQFMIATEAPDDLTARVAQTMQGTGQDSDVAAAGGDQSGDITQVDNIYSDAVAADDEEAEKTADNNNDSGAAPDNDQGNSQDSNQDESSDDSENDDADDSGEDSPIDAAGGDNSDDNSVGEGEAPPSIFSDKNTLKSNVVYFGNIIKTNLETLNTVIGRLDDLNDIRCCNQVIANLQHVQGYIYTMLVEEFPSKSYEELMTKYVTLKRVYDVSVEMLSKHFSKGGKGKSPINPRRSQRMII